MKRILHQIKSKIALNKQKLRKPFITFGVFIALAGGFLFYTNNASAVSWWTGGNGSWGARKQLTVTNNSAASLSSGTSIAISIDTASLVRTGKLRSDCADLRILYQPSSLTTTELTRHIVFPGNSTCATSTATKVYFKIQASLASAASSTDYYLYYKNLSATAPTGTDDAFDVSSANATLVCPFNGTTTCAAGETPSTETGAIRYSGSKSAMSFDGNSDYVTLTDSGQIKAPFNNNTPLTVEFWVKVTKMSNYQDFFGQSSGGANFFIGTTNANTIWVYGDHCTNIDIRGGTIVNNQWTHIAYTQQLGSAKLYQDGVLVGSDTAFSACSTASPTYKLGYAGNGYAGGYIDELRVSSTMRYTSNFARPTNAFVRDSSTALLLHMDESGVDPRNTTKTLDDSGNGNHGTITGANYVAGLVGVDNGTDDTGNVHAQSYAGHEGVFIEEGTTNLITNPSFENTTYNTNWTTGSNLTVTSNATAPYYKFGVKSAKLVASASAISGTSNMFTTNINVGSSATHGVSAFVYDATSGNVGGTISSSIAKIVFQGAAQTTTYTDMGGGWWQLSYAGSAAGAQEFGIEPQVSKTIYVDGVQLEAKTTQLAGYSTSYTDGSLGSGYAWTGTANNSTSTRTAGDLRYATSGNISVSAGTFSAWVWYPSYYSSCSGAHQGILYTNGANPFFLGQNCGTAWFSVNGTNGGAASGTMPTYGTNKWHHYVGTWNGSALTFYIDGTAQTPGSYTATPTATSIILNTNIGGGTGVDTEGVRDLRIFDTALTSTQVTDLYQAGLVGHSEDRQVDAFGDTKGEDPISTYHFDEAQGTTVYDSSVLGNNLTLGTGSSAPTWNIDSGLAAGVSKITSLVFDGINDYVSRAYDTDFDPTTSSFSVSGSFRHPSTISGTDTFLARYGSAGYKVYMNSSGYVCFGIDDDSTWGPDDSACSTSSQGSLADSNWHTFTAVKTSTTSIALYIDGVLVGSDSTLAATATLNPGSTTSLYVGSDSDFTSNPWIGNIDELYFYGYARSAAQIKTDYVGKKGATLGTSTDPFSKGLAGYWKMDESSWNGTTSEVVDSSGNGNHGTRVGDATTASGKLGIGGSFDGSGDYITITDSSSLQPANISVSAWVYSNSNSQWNTVLMKTTSTSWNDGYGLYLDASNNLTFFINNYSTNIAATALTASTWTHITATYDGANIKIYKNGELSATTAYTTAISHSSQALQIGRSPTSGVSSWNGRIDEARIYNRALSSAEVQQLYNYAPGPVGHWKMDEKQGLSAFDSSGNGNTGTLGTFGVGIPPSWGPGKFGSGVKFDKVDDTITITDANSLDTPAGLTIEGWLNFSSVTSGSDDGVFAKWQTGVNDGWFVESNYSGANWRIRIVHSDSTQTEVQVDPGTSTANRWYHIAITYDKSNLKVYRDGILVSTTAATKDIYVNNKPLYIGYSGASGGASHFFPGTIDDVRMYNYGRSQAQVIQDMNAGHPLGGSPVGSQVAHWKLDEGQGTTANDSSINSNSLTLSSATSAWTNSGKFGKAWNGDGALYMSRADDADFDFTAVEDFAISGWVKSDSASNPGSTEYVVNKANATTAGYAVYFNTSGNLCFGIDDDTTWGPDIASCSTADLYDATWHHFSAMRDYSGTLKTFIYVDGISRDSDTDSTSATFANSLSLYVGDRDGTNNGDEFTGDIDEVKIYRGTLTPAEIKIDYNRGQSLVLGSVSNNSTYAPNAANQEYCVPGDATSCAAPVAEWKMDENTGTAANDTSGNANTGTLTFGPTWTSGKVGAGIKFDGSNDYVDLGTGSSMRPNYVTVSAWIKTSATSQFVLSSNHVATSKFGYALFIDASGFVRMTADGVSSALTLLTGSTAVNDNRWHYITGIYDGSKVYVYVDGKQDVTPATYAGGVLEYDSGSSVLGSYYPAGGYYFSGTMDQVRVYDYARTLAQIQWDYNRGAPIAHYRLDECAGTVANDASGNGYTGTITIGASGTNTSAGNCTSGTSSEAWYNGVAGKFNSSLKFDGTDDYVSVADTANLRFDASNADLSLFAWVKRTTTGTEYIISKEDADNDGYRLQFNSSNQVLCSEDATDVTSTATITDTNWHFVGCTIDRDGNGQVYIDGIANGSAVAMGTDAMATTTATSIGTRSYTATSYFAGQIDDVRIYNYALTASQVKNVMNGDFAVRYAPATGQP